MTATPIPKELSDFQREIFASDALTRDVYWPPVPEGMRSPPIVIVCHEMPGMTPEFLAFIAHLRAAGLYPVVPHLFGDVGRPMRVGYFLKSTLSICIAKEFHVLAKGHESPVAAFLRALTREACQRFDVQRVGAVGMCFTGNFALGLLVEPSVVRAVASQPSLPFTFTPGSSKALHLDAESVGIIAKRLADPDDDAAAMALRFSRDMLCPRARFDNLAETFGEHITLREIDSGRDNPHGLSFKAHSVLTVDLVDREGHPTFEARRDVVRFLQEGLIA